MRSEHRIAANGVGQSILDIVAALAAASALVWLIRPLTPGLELTAIYLLAVLYVAIRRSWPAAVLTSLLSVLTFNLLFVEPRYELGISRPRDLAALAVFLIVALVVGRLAATARERARTADGAARAARGAEREAQILAMTASASLTLADGDHRDPPASFADALPDPADSGIELVVGDRPQESSGQSLIPFEGGQGVAWLRGEADKGWDPAALRRLAEPLAKICRLAEERGRMATRRAEVDATRRAEVAKTALLHAVSHDLRSPLTAISTAASAMDPQLLPNGDHRALLAVIEEESSRLAGLVDDLLDVSRIEAGAVDPRLDWCHVSEVAARAAASVRRQHPDQPIDVELPRDVHLVRADAVQLERVFANLLENAVSHSPDRAPVRLSGGVGGGRVHIRVTDAGRGIPLARRSQVFEPFFKGRGNGGSGLGLTICRGFAEANGGEIRIQDAPGGGTSFTVSFPLAAQPSQA